MITSAKNQIIENKQVNLFMEWWVITGKNMQNEGISLNVDENKRGEKVKGGKFTANLEC